MRAFIVLAVVAFLSFAILAVHRAGVARSLRAVGSAAWALAAAWEKAGPQLVAVGAAAMEEFRGSFRACMRRASEIESERRISNV